MNCPNCNAATTSEDVFCPNCGFRLRGGAEESVESQPSSETTNAASPTDSDYAPTPSSITGESTETQQSTDSTSASSTDSDYTYPVDTSSGDDQPENAAEPSLDDSDARAAEPEPRPQYESAPSAGADDQATRPEYSTPPSYQSPPVYQPPATVPPSGQSQSGPAYAQSGYAPQTTTGGKDPTIGFIAEVLPGLFGFLGIGHMYSGNVVVGVGLLVAWWVFLVVEFLLFFVAIGFCLLPLNVIVPVLSAFWVKSNMERRPFGLKW